MIGWVTCSSFSFGCFVVKHVSKHWGDERGNMLEKSRWPDRGGWVSACGPCLSQIRPEIKPGGRVGHGQDTLGQRLTCSATWRSGCWPLFLPRSGWTSSRWGGARITLVTASPLMTPSTISTVCRGFGHLLPTAPPLLPALSAHNQQKLFPAVTACPTTTPTTLWQTRDRPSGLAEDFKATGLRSTRAW